jgi:hypothetical protein
MPDPLRKTTSKTITDTPTDMAENIKTETEQWFVARGTPHLVASFDASEHVLGRTVPLLMLVFYVQTLRGILRGWPQLPIWGTVLAAAVVLLAARVVLNLTWQRPLLSRATSLGIVEATVFVLVPALVWFVATGTVADAVTTAAINLGALLVIYLGTSFGVVRSWIQGTSRAIRGFEAVVGMAFRALPLLLIVFTFFFVNSELWQVGNEIARPLYWSTLVLVLLVIVAVGFWRGHRSVDLHGGFETVEEIQSLCENTPVEPVASEFAAAALESPPLDRRQRIEMTTLLAHSMVVQVFIISVLVTVFFVVFGLLIIPPTVIEAWTGDPITAPIVAFSAFGVEVGVTVELLRVSGLLGAVSALYFSVNSVVDETYREEFSGQLPVEVRRTLAVHAVYHALVDAMDDGGGAVSSPETDHRTGGPQGRDG